MSRLPGLHWGDDAVNGQWRVGWEPHEQQVRGWTPWGSKTQIRSRGASVVLVDEPAQQVPAANISRADRQRVPGFGRRWGEGANASVKRTHPGAE